MDDQQKAEAVFNAMVGPWLVDSEADMAWISSTDCPLEYTSLQAAETAIVEHGSARRYRIVSRGGNEFHYTRDTTVTFRRTPR